MNDIRFVLSYIDGGAVVALLAIVTLISVIIYYRKKIKSIEKKHKKRGISISDYKQMRTSVAVTMDSQKRKSLMPANQKVIPPKEFEMPREMEISRKHRVSPHRPTATPPLEESFKHKFYGTSLSVGNSRLLFGLNNGLHTLEITKYGLFVDNQEYKINYGDLERIKQLVRNSRK